MPRTPLRRSAALLALLLVAVAPQVSSAATAAPVTVTVSASAGTPDVPAPTVRQPIGTTTLRLVDTSRTDPWKPAAGPRELMASLWYPARSNRGARAPYVSAALSREIVGDEALAAVRTQAVANAFAVPKPHPLIVLSPGFGGSRTSLTAWAEELAARGYVVATVDHTYEAPVEFPGGRIERCLICVGIPDDALVVRTRSADIRFLIDRLTGPGTGLFVDRTRIGVAGHSMGGAAAVEAMRDDPRVDAAVNLDGDFWTEPPAAGLNRPVLLLGAQRTLGPVPNANWQHTWDRLTGWKRWLDVAGAGHLSFCDMPWIVDGFGIREQIPPEEAGPQYGTMSGARATAVTRAYLTAFFDRHLRGRSSPLLDRPSAAYPEVAFVG